MSPQGRDHLNSCVCLLPCSPPAKEVIPAFTCTVGARGCVFAVCDRLVHNAYRMYRMPCEQEVDISRVLMFRSAQKRQSREGVKDLIGEVMARVDQCIECSECEQKFPYNLHIPDLLKGEPGTV